MANWLEDVLAQLQGGGAPNAPASPFPDVPAYSTPQGQDTAAALAAAGEAGGAPFGFAQPGGFRRTPDANSAGVQFALNNAPAGTGVPGPLGEMPPTDAERQMMAMVGRPASGPPAGAPDGTPFGSPAPFGPGTTIPPSVQLASQIAAPSPPQSGPPPVPGALPPPGAVPTPRPRPDGAPDDVEGGPTDVSAQSRAPQAAAPMGIPAPAPPAEIPLAQRIANIGPGLMGVGAAMQGDMGHLATANAQKEQALQLQRQQGNATARLLASKGATAPEIQAAISGGPDTIKALLGQYMGKDKFSVVQSGETEDQYGAKQKVFKVFNANDGTFKDIPASSASEAKAAAATSSVDNSGLTGQERLTALKAANPDYARQVEAVVDGRESFPTGRQAQTPAGRKLIQDVQAVSGRASEADFKNMQAVRKRYTSGKDFDITKSLNTVVQHGRELVQAVDDLHNYSVLPGFINPVTGKIAEQYDRKYQAALGRFKQNADTFARDYDFAVSGGRPTVSGRQAQRELFDEYGSPDKNMGAIQKSMELLRDRLNEHQRGYDEGRLPSEGQSIVPHLQPDTVAFIEKMAAAGHGGERTAAPAAAVKPGNYVWKNGALVPE